MNYFFCISFLAIFKTVTFELSLNVITDFTEFSDKNIIDLFNKDWSNFQSLVQETRILP